MICDSDVVNLVQQHMANVWNLSGNLHVNPCGMCEDIQQY